MLERVDEPDDVQVIELAQGFALTPEPLEHGGINSQIAGNDLDSRGPAGLDVCGAVNRAHRAFADPGVDCVALVEGLANHWLGPGRVS